MKHEIIKLKDIDSQAIKRDARYMRKQNKRLGKSNTLFYKKDGPKNVEELVNVPNDKAFKYKAADGWKIIAGNLYTELKRVSPALAKRLKKIVVSAKKKAKKKATKNEVYSWEKGDSDSNRKWLKVINTFRGRFAGSAVVEVHYGEKNKMKKRFSGSFFGLKSKLDKFSKKHGDFEYRILLVCSDDNHIKETVEG